MLGFETIGSATLICFDEKPILATDPWISKHAYFGSWCHDYEIPRTQIDHIRECPFIWISHGHPDHLDPNSIESFTGRTILLAAHRGGRIEQGLRNAGLSVQVLPSKEWVAISPRIRVMSFSNVNQDSILLVAMGDTLIINLNDSPLAQDRAFIRTVSATFREVFHLQLVGWGGADMQNLYSPDGSYLGRPLGARTPLATNRQLLAKSLRATHTIPFSSFHRYQRSDSVWANELIPEVKDYLAGAVPGWPEVLKPFIRFEVNQKSLEYLEPAQLPFMRKSPEHFGDNSSDTLDSADWAQLQAYFLRFESLQSRFGFLEFEVGGITKRLALNPAIKAGFTFSVPRNSLMTAVEHEIFDDLLIGNFMRVCVHGDASLYPWFSPYVGKYGDNGMARSNVELADYMHHYRFKPQWENLKLSFETFSTSAVKLALAKDSALFKLAKKTYHVVKSR
jgi:hypothetical protein